MPIPTYNEKNNGSNTTNDTQQAAQSATATTSSNSHATTTSFAGTNFPAAVNEQGQPLSKEEADRLYEERMEEEYAKREGGA
ncbi:hypothetical protein ASPCAL02108 [Aspergillus calidoustus]|jgi:hypothetical protein|uniref:Uncharacterized protein n=1 Tax=Aspergillus calidoustus TaxID=454130 RepID=A0A0U5GNX3_ASPCI|nr:hypothetical protein ASPCAL02108 [Aspergillus calidoustus]